MAQASLVGGEFEQEINTDLDPIQSTIHEIADNLDSVIDEASTLWDDFEEMESFLREGLDEEN